MCKLQTDDIDRRFQLWKKKLLRNEEWVNKTTINRFLVAVNGF